ncbi:hypothetical protein KFL_002150195 [Klebsormidium nitens]|uniref:Uncharacterized protein n=1 Tax=Klebsormidium nitens TaxID=105231 RepID=A0A1Y1I242_KLENI|nr:hypothetical protein KFL_002150195 [Klebsormidium nitens]|eukprot:GAQ84984.1 hypothetical protein KFL_002150195 [Klebsormidium nitens]
MFCGCVVFPWRRNLLALQGFVPTPWAWSLEYEHRLLEGKRLEEWVVIHKECERTARALAETALERGAQEEEITKLADRHRHCQALLSQKDHERRQAEDDWMETARKNCDYERSLRLQVPGNEPNRKLWFQYGDDVREIPLEENDMIRLLGDAPYLATHFKLEDSGMYTLDGKEVDERRGLDWTFLSWNGAGLTRDNPIVIRADPEALFKRLGYAANRLIFELDWLIDDWVVFFGSFGKSQSPRCVQ